MFDTNPNTRKIAVIGLGYVGLPLAVAFGKIGPVVGFDINSARIKALQSGQDSTQEVDPQDLVAAQGLIFTDDVDELGACDTYIVTVPTPITAGKQPDLSPLLSASETVGRVLKKGDLVIFESTVYPGATEEDCVPILERTSDLTFNADFYVGYSPERINPGDKAHRISDICKVTSGSTPKAADLVDALYARIIAAGTHKAESIRVAEAAKVIENTQRDLNIALVNELAMIFGRLGIDTDAVLRAAGTKWNFLPFRPGLVGGHCIGVDPYYLTHKAETVGHHPQIILAGRRLNDSMGGYVVAQLVKRMTREGIDVGSARVLIMGLTFKENCPDLRNTRVVDIIRELGDYGIAIDVYDPHADISSALSEYDIRLISDPQDNTYDGVVLAVAHQEFLDMNPAQIRAYGKDTSVVFDVKSVLPLEASDLRL